MSTISYTCTCGKQLKFRNEHAGRKTKCPECNEVITVPDSETDELEDYDDEAPSRAPAVRSSRGMLSVTGKRAIVQWGQVVPSMWGRTTFELDSYSLVENTQSILTRKHLSLLLTEIEGAEIRVQPNPALLGAAIVLIPVFLIGLLVLPFYFIQKYRVLVIHTSGNAAALVMSGKEDPYREFMEAVLAAAQRAKQRT